MVSEGQAYQTGFVHYTAHETKWASAPARKPAHCALYSLPRRDAFRFLGVNRSETVIHRRLPSRPRQQRGAQNNCLHGGNDDGDVEVGAGRPRATPRGGVRGLRQGRRQRGVRAVRGRDGEPRRRVHLRGGLRGARRLLLRRRAALPLRRPPHPSEHRQARALPPHRRRDFAPHRQRLRRRRPDVCWWIHGSICREEIRSKVAARVRRQQLVHGHRLHPGLRVPQGHAPEPLLEGGRLLVVLRAGQLRVRRKQLRDQDVELQGHRRAGGLQPRDPARLLRHRQARGGAQLVVRGVQAEAVLTLRPLLRPQGLPRGPVQQLVLARRVVASYRVVARALSVCSCGRGVYCHPCRVTKCFAL